jgi:hypothetical protein
VQIITTSQQKGKDMERIKTSTIRNIAIILGLISLISLIDIFFNGYRW